MYALIRTTPEGVERISSPVASVRDAAVRAAHILHDNARVSKAEAQRFSATLARIPLGDTGVHLASGYRFRIERTD